VQFSFISIGTGSHAGTTQAASIESVSLRRLVVGEVQGLIESNRSNRL